MSEDQDSHDAMSVEDALRRSESQLSEAQSIAHIGSWEWDIPGDEITWSDELCRIFGVPEGVVPDSYESYLECVHPDDRDMVNDTVQGAYASLEPYHFVHRIQWPDGTIRTVDSLGRVIAGDDGAPVRMLGTAQDITELKRAEAARLEAEERFRRAFEDSGDRHGARLGRPEGAAGRVLEANDAICAITGLRPRDAASREDIEAIIHPDDLAEVDRGAAARSSRATSRASRSSTGSSPAPGRCTGSRSRPRSSAARDGEPRHRLVQLQDISERKRFEGQLQYLADHDSAHRPLQPPPLRGRSSSASWRAPAATTPAARSSSSTSTTSST